MIEVSIRLRYSKNDFFCSVILKKKKEKKKENKKEKKKHHYKTKRVRTYPTDDTTWF